MMESAEPRDRYNPAAFGGSLHCFAACRSLLVQTKMCPVAVVVMDILAHQAFEMPLIEDNHMVEQFAAAVSDPALGDAILPRTAEAGSFWLDAEALDGIDDLFIELRAAIKDQVARRGVVRKCLRSC
jgi:hypothetical protein